MTPRPPDYAEPEPQLHAVAARCDRLKAEVWAWRGLFASLALVLLLWSVS